MTATTIQKLRSSAVIAKSIVLADTLNKAADELAAYAAAELAHAAMILTDSNKRMFEAACADLGVIGQALGTDPDSGGAEEILEAIEELKNKPPIGKKLSLTGLQISYLHDACGGEFDVQLCISRFPATSDVETSEVMPEGLYCWYEDSPGEGRTYLPEKNIAIAGVARQGGGDD